MPWGRLHYLDWGRHSPTAHPVILLHGFNQTCHSWDEFATRMSEHAADDFRLLALDQRGHGESDWARDRDYSREAMAGDIGRFMAALDIERASLVAMSMGAVHAAVFAAKEAERITALILVDYAPETETVGIGKIKQLALLSWPSFEAAVTAVHAYNPRREKDNIRERLRHSLRQLDDGRFTWRVDLEGLAQSPRFALPAQLMWRVMADIECPTLVIRGGESDVLSAAMAARLRDTLPHGHLVSVDGAGHSVPGDNPETFYRVAADFLCRSR